MRLIDADDLKEGIACHKQWTDQEFETDRQWAVGYNAGIERALFSITYAHAIEAELVRHGRWVVVEPYGWNCRGYNVTPKIKCSVCEHVPKAHKTEDYGQGGTIVRYTWDRTLFCPNCGAKMDAEEEKGCLYGMTTVSKLCSVMNSLTASIMTFGDAGTDES